MSFLDSYAASLVNLGIENPSSREFVDRPDLRTIVAFFLGWTFIAALRYLVLAVLRHPISAHLLRAALRRPILVTAAERQRASDVEGNHIQHWLHNTFSGPSTQSDRPEGTRHLSVVLTTAFALGVLMNFLSLLDYQNSGQDVLCIVVIAWAGISVACAKLAGLLRITIDLSRLGTGRIEKLASWFVLALSFGATLAHVTISIGATRDVPQLATLSLCYRRHFLLTSLIMSLLNITLEMYFMGRLFFLLVPEFLQFHHKVEIMMDVRVARVASILLLDLLMLLPSALSINLAAEFVPFSLGTLLVLAAFNHHPTKPANTQGFEHSASRTSVITFPRNQDDDHSIASTSPDQAEKIKPASLSPPAAPKSVKRRPTQKSRDLRASHISYDSEAEARSVRGAVVSFAFRSQEIEPMPAVPYGVFQPKLVGSPIIMPRAAQLPPVPSTSLSESHAHASLVQKPLPVPKPALGSAKLPVPPKDARPDSPAASIYGSDVIRRPMPDGPPKSSTVRPGSSSTVSRITTHSHGYTGPDLRHYSMSTSTQSPVSEPRDYLEVSPPRPGLVRTLTFGGRSTASYGQTSRVPSRNSSAGIQVAQEPRVI